MMSGLQMNGDARFYWWHVHVVYSIPTAQYIQYSPVALPGGSVRPALLIVQDGPRSMQRERNKTPVYRDKLRIV